MWKWQRREDKLRGKKAQIKAHGYGLKERFARMFGIKKEKKDD